jgi:hypothetical protein
VFDMGCAFELKAGDGITAVSVSSGWVQLENDRGEMLVPEGAHGTMRLGSAPSIPLFLDALPEFRGAVARLEEGTGSEADVEAMRSSARPRDAYTILLLALRSVDHRAELIELAARLAPPPTDAVRERATRGDRRGTFEWIRALDLPPPKGWVRNWRDAFGDPGPR